MIEVESLRKRYQVFVSSTYEDLVEERTGIMQVLLELDCIPAGMELFPAADDDSWTLIKKVIDNSDYYLVVVGGRYGSVGLDGKSYTQMEYEYAICQGKPVLAFVHGNPNAISAARTEREPAAREALAAFVRLVKRKNCRTWTTPQDLAAVVGRSVHHLMIDKPAGGWIRANEAAVVKESDARASKRVGELASRISELEEKLRVAEVQLAHNQVQREKQTPLMPVPQIELLSILEEAANRLKRIRERLRLKYRDVEAASLKIAEFFHNDEFLVSLSRLSDIENKGTLPSLFRVYSLAVIYRIDFAELLSWYGVDLKRLPEVAVGIGIGRTHLFAFQPEENAEVEIPLILDPGLNVQRTNYLSRFVQRWGKLPLVLLKGLDPRHLSYAMIGTEDFTMYPLIPPGSLVRIDTSQRRILEPHAEDESKRPIYLLEHRDGYICSWCRIVDGRLFTLPHPQSACDPAVYRYPEEIEIIGRVTGVVMDLDVPLKRYLTR
ncbi:MAG TPA: DUF4062 domain-containing protein [Bryobacteraceae bacterium]|jgi:transcriptional regulator with XRE-family HTH domain